jgi:hypothetical protein
LAGVANSGSFSALASVTPTFWYILQPSKNTSLPFVTAIQGGKTMSVVTGPWKTLAGRVHVNEADTRLDVIKGLWQQLAHLHADSKNYQDLVREIRREADAFRKGEAHAFRKVDDAQTAGK